MTIVLTPGRWRGLQTTSTDHHAFAILAFDQRGNYVKMLPQPTSYAAAQQIKVEVISALSKHVSAVLLDPDYGLEAALHSVKNCGLLMALEKTGYSGDPNYRYTEFLPNWTVAKIKQMGAQAVKLLIYYHPDSGSLAAELDELVQNISTECHQHDIPLFVEPLLYSLNDDKSLPNRAELVAETARRLSRLGCDVLKLEFPVDVAVDQNHHHWRAACEAISAVCETPWALLSAGVDFSVFEQQVQIACSAGASGFMGGRAIWKECITMNPADRQHFLTTTGAERLNRLIEITQKHARPWTDFYTPMPATENWFLDYAEPG